ncbi:MAG TPA: SDR family NAD(P)-dependent oxidoreductase [Pseudolysinimonas sp.]|nr:SDR family NAD(P)-dependent oxidoreductase [Pseudolysinimonas sp.]
MSQSGAEGTPLAGRRAVVTGGSSGIGLAIAVALAEAGSEVHVLARRTAPVIEADAELTGTGSLTAHSVDVSDSDAVGAWASGFTGPVDVLVCAAGVNVPARRFGELTPDAWRRIIDTNLNGAFYVTSALIGRLREAEGDVLYISSVAGAWPDHSGAAYGASKSGLIGLARGAGRDEHGSGVRVCTILPGLVNTPLLDNRPAPPPQNMRDLFIQPEDVAAACLAVLLMPKRTSIAEMTIVASRLQSMGNTQDATPRVPPMPAGPVH